MTESRHGEKASQFDPQICPGCGERSVSTRIEDKSFPYGAGESRVNLSARVAVHHCRTCNDEFLDSSAEDTRHEAVCRHLGVLTPSEITSIRTKHGYNRADFARLTQFGEASLSRWENSLLVQNAANDQFLYLLWFSDNIDRLRTRTRGRLPASSTVVASKEPDNVLRFEGRFRALTESQISQHSASTFALQPAG